MNITALEALARRRIAKMPTAHAYGISLARPVHKSIPTHAIGAKPAPETLHRPGLEPPKFVVRPKPRPKPLIKAAPKPRRVAVHVAKPAPVPTQKLNPIARPVIPRGTHPAPGTPVPAKWQVDHASLKQLAAMAKKAGGRLGAFGRLGSFGLSPSAEQIGGAVGSKVAAAGATSLATTLGASAAVAGPIGLAAGAVIAIAMTFFTKKYFNVSQANAGVAAHIKAWQQYLTIQGHVAGRALGMKSMVLVMKGAMALGLFPGNTKKFCFHEGCVNGVGNGEWVDTFMQDGLSNLKGQENLSQFLRMYQSARGGKPVNVPDAVYFVDYVMLPWFAHTKGHTQSWILRGSQNSQIHQLLYDCVDAYLGEKMPSSTPYVEYPASQVQATAGAEGIPTGYTAPSPTSTSSATSGAPATPSVSGSVIGTGTQGAIQQMLASGASQQQVYDQLLSALASQGTQLNAAQQGQLASGIDSIASSGGYASAGPAATPSASGVPAGSTAAIATGAKVSSPAMIALFVGALGVGGFFVAKREGWLKK